jgi:hypothetical protein
MAANSSLNLTSLDFDTLKSNLVTFLKSQDIFKDYDFTGSNMNVLLDVMSYNTYLNSFYLNMVASEMFLDSAQKYDSVISHAKELNYVPQSSKSSEAIVDVVFETVGLNGKLTIPQGTVFSGINSNGSFYFITNYTATYTSANNTYYANNIEIFEGSTTSQAFTTDYTIENQRFILQNSNIDLNSLTVNVVEDNGYSNTLFTKVDSLYGLNNQSNVYFIQASQNNLYELVFGDGVYGRKPQNGAIINANYRIAKGKVADGVSKFQVSQELDSVNGGVVNVTSVTTVANSSSGASSETIEDIRFRAPRWYAAQQRGVSNDDYKSLIYSEFGSYIQDINVFGGQEIEPKKYGSVVVCIKPIGGTIIPNYLKNEITNYMLDKSQMKIIMQDPDYIYLSVNSDVYYNPTQTTLYANDIKNLVLQNIINYSSNYLEHFNSNFRYSRFASSIDGSEPSIISNQTEVLLEKRLYPLLNYTTAISFSYDNSADVETKNPSIGYTNYKPFGDEPVVTSSSFTYVDVNGISYPLCYIRDDNTGVLVVYKDVNGIFTVINNNLGTIDYDTGVINISKFTTSYYDQYISIYMAPKNKDVMVSKTKILLIDPNDVNINTVGTSS